MPTVSESIPSALQSRVDAAVAWFNASSDAANEEFKVTGIIDPDDALRGSDELRLILCGGDRCEQRAFKVTGEKGAWAVEIADLTLPANKAKPQAELDPPPGVRSGWLDKVLAQHEFVLLLFYRGFW